MRVSFIPQFGIMNEPHDLNSVSTWAESVQVAVNAIRAAGATSQHLLLPGSSWSSAQALPTEAGPFLLNVTDPVGGTSKLLFDGRLLRHSPSRKVQSPIISVSS